MTNTNPFNFTTQLTDNFRLMNKIVPSGNIFSSFMQNIDDQLGIIYNDGSTLQYLYVDPNSSTGWSSTSLPVSNNGITQILSYANGTERACLFLQNDGSAGVVTSAANGQNWIQEVTSQQAELGPVSAALYTPNTSYATQFYPGGLLFAVGVIDQKIYPYFFTPDGQLIGMIMNAAVGDGNPEPINIGADPTGDISISGFSGSLSVFIPVGQNSYMLTYAPSYSMVSLNAVALQDSSRDASQYIVAGKLFNSIENQQVFVSIMDDGKVFCSTFNESNNQWQATTQLNCVIPDNLVVKTLQAGEFTDPTDGKNYMHIFFTDENNDLYHLRAVTEGIPAATFSDYIVVGNAPNGFQLGCDNSNDFNIFLTDADGSLRCYWQDESTYHWNYEFVQVPPATKGAGYLETFRSYTCSIDVNGDKGSPLPGVDVELYASEATQVQVNGSQKYIPSNGSITVTSNIMGRINLVYETTGMYVPSFWLQVSKNNAYNLASAQTALFYQPGEELITKFTSDKTVLVNELINQQYPDSSKKGQYIIPEEYRNVDSLTPVIETVQAMAEIMAEGITQSSSQPAGNPDRSILTSRLNTTGMKPRAFKFENKDQGPSFKWLDADATTPQSSSDLEQTIEAGDLFSAINNGLLSLQSMTLSVSPSKQSKELTSNFAGPVDPYFIQVFLEVYNPSINQTITHTVVIKSVDEILDGVQSVFASVKTLIHQVWTWIASFLNWDDIKLTHAAIYNYLYNIINDLPSYIGNYKSSIVTELESVKDSSIKALGNLQGTVANYLGLQNLSVQSVTSAHPGGSNFSEQGANIKNNLLFNIFMDHMGDAKVTDINGIEQQSTTIVDSLGNEVLDIWQQLEDFITKNFESLSYIKKAFEEFIGLFQDPDNMGSVALDIFFNLLKGITGLAIELMELLVKTIFDLLSKMIVVFRDMLTQKWEVTFLGHLYEGLVKMDEVTLADGKKPHLCALSLISLIAAIPGTTVYKLVTQKAPFSSMDDVNAFTTYTQGLLTGQTGSNVSKAADAGDSDDLVNKKDLIFGIITGFFTIGGGVISAICDIQAVADFGAGAKMGKNNSSSTNLQSLTIPSASGYAKPERIINFIGLVMQWGVWSFSSPFPLTFNDKEHVQDSSEGIAKLIAGCSVFPLGLDTILILLPTKYKTKSLPWSGKQAAYNGDAGAIFTSVLSTLYFGLNCWYMAVARQEILNDTSLSKEEQDDMINANNQGIASTVIGSVPSMAKFVRCKPIVEATYGISLAALAAGDLLCGVASGILTITQAATQYSINTTDYSTSA